MISAYKRLLKLILTLLVIPACMKLEPEIFADKDIIGFNVVGQSLKTKSAFSTSSTFTTTAYELADGKSWSDDYESAIKYFGPESVSFQSGGYWTTDTKHYWPDNGSLTFFSYSLGGMNTSPSPVISKTGVTINNYSVIENPNGEIMVADIAMDKTKNESYAGFSGVPTHFKHKLTKVQFKLSLSELADPGTIVKLKSITLSEVYTKGSYSRGGYPNESWGAYTNLVSDMNPIRIFEGEKQLADAPESVGNTIIMLPQYVNKVSDVQHAGIVVNYTIINPDTTQEDKSVICYFDEHFGSGVWEAGKIHTYIIKIGVGLYPILFNGSVSVWSNENNGTVDIGG